MEGSILRADQLPLLMDQDQPILIKLARYYAWTPWEMIVDAPKRMGQARDAIAAHVVDSLNARNKTKVAVGDLLDVTEVIEELCGWMPQTSFSILDVSYCSACEAALVERPLDPEIIKMLTLLIERVTEYSGRSVD